MYKVIWSDDAESDYYNTLVFWTKHNKSNSYSKKLIANVERKINYLIQNPNSGIATNFHNTYKVPILKYFSLYYRLSEQTIEIIAFWDNRRNPENLEL
ncbi:type II toxin-antitoxin system RelE/ParE family toxin [Epilithonimonas hominis]|jgi:plasmid stabilization system protein ParE|uniref:Plasmid stabilization system protein ParE n=1 Tax=Epilithonimonas hominis TaxID=420404 RepID=A0A1H6IRR9_9FLAO|nr:type II toxin-antitoxin system RelE/ParE family toxin [Epilithonimonas hominis]ROI13293.1 type II toxin-antitoxin system RelE/ParE family toxin [Epilithonimonas hominis]SEH51908.1 Plasmid stabilization system protein ParE [Epilithonimonas hominis]HAP96164.1 type II toxin-antitoxin system RelE/ParE family toxin [Chryseobacterium sp.]